LKPTDLATIAGAVVLLVITAQVAAYVPAWRASRVDPLAALRHE
jgi:ABC-type lipoprotein release transport system permease subunit